MINYFNVLELSIDQIDGKDETTIKSIVTDAHKRLYKFTTGSYANVPRPDRRTQAQWQVILNDARDTLLEPQKRREHITELTQVSDLTERKEETYASVPRPDGKTQAQWQVSLNDLVDTLRKEKTEKKEETDVNLKDVSGKTPLHTAVLEDDHQKIRLLLLNGADVNAIDKWYKTPLHYATYQNAFEIVELLLRNGADVNAKALFDITPLHITAQKNASETAKVLLRYGADINVQKTEYKLTPLHEAIDSDSYEVAEILLENGADVNAKSEHGRRPLHIAEERYKDRMVKLLREHGGRRGVLW